MTARLMHCSVECVFEHIDSCGWVHTPTLASKYVDYIILSHFFLKKTGKAFCLPRLCFELPAPFGFARYGQRNAQSD